MKEKTDAEIDPALYREGMARYAGHVQLVTTQWQGVRRGVTVTAACSVSDNPATVLVCLNSGNSKNAIFAESGVFALNSLASQHRELASGFAGLNSLSNDDRFALGQWTSLATGAPVLKDAAVVFDCRILEIKEMSTHFVMFGEVKAMELTPGSSALIYHERAFRDLA